jgi:hypothetical protein
MGKRAGLVHRGHKIESYSSQNVFIAYIRKYVTDIIIVIIIIIISLCNWSMADELST